MVNRFSSAFTGLQRLHNLILPASCILCGGSGTSRLDICPPCREDLPWLGNSCPRCALPLPESADTQLCGQCLTEPPQFQRTLACWQYQPPLAQLIASYKYHGKLSYGRSLALLTAEAIVSAYNKAELPDLITAVPLHWRRQLQRGFNQSALLANTIAGELGLPFHPLLKRTRTTPAQQQLDAGQRRKNLRGAFHCRRDLNGMRIALVDDVMTTGATANEISRVLKTAGAGEVHIWCLARTPK